MPKWLQPRADGVAIEVRVTPKASRDSIGPERDGRLVIKVTAPPEDGKANAAVCKLVAKRLGLAKSLVAVDTGETSRSKRLIATGISIADASARLTES